MLRGSAINQDGRSSGFTAPNVLAQRALIEAALADAALAPADIGLIEAHGTGTALGDPIEMDALVAALGSKNHGAPLYAAAGIKTTPLAVALASHSRLMEPILPAFHAAIAPLAFAAPTLPIVSTVTGARADTLDADHWCRHVRAPVRFHQAAEALHALDIDVCLEIGPDATLAHLVTAAGVFPAERALASLRRGTSDRTSLDATARSFA
ncbi:MAG TPA: acyltransferase domain-containing protein [Kofleriaceae bacterium]|nr:acyltransferase domain-containing protein [Kofleriaceae bacterium]